MNSIRLTLTAMACGFAVIAPAADTLADEVVPSFDVFGELPEATWGGSGIDNDNVAITTIEVGDDTITLGMSAHERFVGPLANDGAGTFFAPPGLFDPDGAGPTIPAAAWNFNFYMNIDGGGTFDDYNFNLRYTFDPTFGTDLDDHGTLDFNTAVDTLGGDLSTTTLAEGSENLDFAFLADGGLPFIDPPAGTFDPDALGQYSFVLEAWSGDGSTLLGTSAILVTVPTPGALALLGIAGLAGGRRRRRA